MTSNAVRPSRKSNPMRISVQARHWVVVYWVKEGSRMGWFVGAVVWQFWQVLITISCIESWHILHWISRVPSPFVSTWAKPGFQSGTSNVVLAPPVASELWQLLQSGVEGNLLLYWERGIYSIIYRWLRMPPRNSSQGNHIEIVTIYLQYPFAYRGVLIRESSGLFEGVAPS